MDYTTAENVHVPIGLSNEISFISTGVKMFQGLNRRRAGPMVLSHDHSDGSQWNERTLVAKTPDQIGRDDEFALDIKRTTKGMSTWDMHTTEPG